jgi:hypothetical protein
VTKIGKNHPTRCTFVNQIIIVPLPNDTLISQTLDSLSQKDTTVFRNTLLETGKELFAIFLHPHKTLHQGVEINHWENIWQFGFLLTVLLLLAILRSGFSNRMNQFFNAIIASRQLRQLMREDGFLYHPFSILLLLNTGIIYSLIIYKSLHFFKWNAFLGTGFQSFILLLSIILLIIFLKIMALRLMEFLTDTDLGQRENRYTWVLFHQLGGIILLPFAAIMLFGKAFWVLPAIILCSSFFIIFLIFRIGKGFVLASGNKVYFLHLFLYLCALEIIPLIVLLKVLVTQINGFNE